jgi:hypothetical protein
MIGKEEIRDWEILMVWHLCCARACGRWFSYDMPAAGSSDRIPPLVERRASGGFACGDY